MHRLFIHCLNAAFLVLIFIGLPAATRAQWGNWQISRAVQSEWLIFGGLLFAAAFNAVAALGPFKSLKVRKVCMEWTVVFALLALVQYAFNRGYINFDWLKQSLLWLRDRF